MNSVFRGYMGTLSGEGVGAEGLAGQFGPVMRAFVEYAIGRDLRTGRKITETFPGAMTLEEDWNRHNVPQFFRDNLAGKMLYSTVDRPSDALLNIINLYMDNGQLPEATMIAMRYKAERDWAGLNRLLLGKEYGVEGAIPGLAIYAQDALKNLLRQKREAVKRAGGY
jgi:hypothetical protein